MTQSTLDTFESTGPEPPYPIPYPESVGESTARSRHREWYWEQHDKDTYQCPDCDRGLEDVYKFHIHHIDRNPRNGDPGNLVGLCRSCHIARHGGRKCLSRLSVEEWKDEFENITESEWVWGT